MSFIVGTLLRSIGHTPEGAAPGAPTFSSLANDGDGDSVTAVVDGDSGVTNQFYYRTGAATAWTPGESRSGDGSLTQAGLVENTTYSFLFVSSSGGLYSLPSTERGLHVTAISTTFIESWNPTVLVANVRQFLIDQTIVTTVNCFCKMFPDEPVNAFCVNVTEPSSGDEAPQYPVRRMNFQVLIRNTNIQTGSYYADRIHNAMSRRVNFLAGSEGICRAQHGPGQWFFSEANYPVFTLNYEYRTVQRG